MASEAKREKQKAKRICIAKDGPVKIFLPRPLQWFGSLDFEGFQTVILDGQPQVS